MGMTIVNQIDSKKQPLSDPNALDWERNWSVWLHISGLALLGLSFVGIVLPIVLWMVKRGDSPFVDDHGREVINFQLSIQLYLVICGIAACTMIPIPVIVILPLIGVINLIRGAVAAGKGEYFRYPITIRFLS